MCVDLCCFFGVNAYEYTHWAQTNISKIISVQASQHHWPSPSLTSIFFAWTLPLPAVGVRTPLPSPCAAHAHSPDARITVQRTHMRTQSQIRRHAQSQARV